MENKILKHTANNLVNVAFYFVANSNLFKELSLPTQCCESNKHTQHYYIIRVLVTSIKKSLTPKIGRIVRDISSLR